MSPVEGERGGILVMRVWREGEPPAFRARLTFGAVDDPTPEVVTVSEVEDALDAVRVWLKEADPA